MARSDPKGFHSGDGGPLTIDEVQLAPALLREIKRLVDDDRKPGRFLLTGSADLDHCADLSSVLAGRVGILRLPPITISEQYQSSRWRKWLEAEDVGGLDKAFGRQKSEPFEVERILISGYPNSLLSRSMRARRLWMGSFRTTYLERDLRLISDIGNLVEFARFMQLAAAATGTVLNQAHLARDVGMSSATAGRHLSILEASFLLTRLPPFMQILANAWSKLRNSFGMTPVLPHTSAGSLPSSLFELIR